MSQGPLYAPDGKSYWNGTAWIPVQAPPKQSVGCVTHTTCLVIIGLALVLPVILIAVGAFSQHS